MERTLISWNIPNMITIWLMIMALILFYTLAAQGAMKAGWISGGSNNSASNAGGY